MWSSKEAACNSHGAYDWEAPPSSVKPDDDGGHSKKLQTFQRLQFEQVHSGMPTTFTMSLVYTHYMYAYMCTHVCKYVQPTNMCGMDMWGATSKRLLDIVSLFRRCMAYCCYP